MGRRSRLNAKESGSCKTFLEKPEVSSRVLDKGADIRRVTTSSSHRFALIAVAVASFVTRFYDIYKPDHVCWDETHFGKMASWYINRTFFFDVHPPLGKMLIALSGHITGYDGRFPYEKPGDRYDDWTQYVGMRLFCALLGFAIPIIIFRSVHALTRSQFASITAAFLIVFDNGTITLTRYILLDSPLLFFISTSILGLCEFSFRLRRREDGAEFSGAWWFWLIWTGVSIACAFSVKFVGLFIVALVGFRTCYDLWQILGDLSKPLSNFVKHFAARALCLIILPIVLYMTIFWTHLELLSHSGTGDGFYSSSFQSRLIGNSLHNSSWPAHLAYGAQVTLKNTRIGGAYLHSHWHLYPEGVGAKQQQVTGYSHKDSNNKWLIKRGPTDASRQDDVFVRDGDLIVLEHVTTKRNLHSHSEPAPLTKYHYQVTCYGEGGRGDANDLWLISKETSGGGEAANERILTVKTRFRLIHHLTNCALHSHSKQLPKWAYEQLEVTCNPKLHDKNNFWNIEDNFYPKLPNVSFEEYAPSFLERFAESHAVMLQGNAGLKPKEGEVTSRPWQWPLNYRGQFFSASKDHKIYLLGNPSVWWLNIVAVPVSLLIMLLIAIRNKLKLPDRDQESTSVRKVVERVELSGKLNSDYLEASSWVMLGWVLHYLPFYFMGRVLYFHHYFPAFIFNCMQTAMTCDYLITLICFKLFRGDTRKKKLETFIVLAAFIFYTFTRFTPLTYGTKEEVGDESSTIEKSRSERHLASLKWLDSWEF